MAEQAYSNEGGNLLPEGWTIATLKDILSISSGKNLPQSRMIEGSIPVFGGNGITGWHNAPNVTEETIVIGRVGYYCGSVHLTPSLAWITDNAFITQFAKACISRNFLYRLLVSTNLRKNDNGSAQPVISGSKIYPIEIGIPPLAEQKVIADKLDTMLAQVENTKARLERIPQILKTFRQSVLAAAVSGKLTEEWTSENLILADIADFQNGYAFKSEWFKSHGEYQVIKLGNIRDGYLAIENAPAYLKRDIAEDYFRFTPNAGDTLISMTGTRFKQDYGFGCLVSGEENLLVNQRVGRLMPDKSIVLPEYLNIFVRSELFRVQFFKGETGGVNQGNVGSKHIMNIKVKLPAIEQQIQIVRRVEELFAFADNIEQKANAALERVNNLTQSILAKAFRGELTADWRAQNPELISGDNSAEALLTKIKAERDKLAKTKLKRGKTREN